MGDRLRGGVGCVREGIVEVVGLMYGGGLDLGGQKYVDSGCILEIELIEFIGKLQKGGRIREKEGLSFEFCI